MGALHVLTDTEDLGSPSNGSASRLDQNGGLGQSRGWERFTSRPTRRTRARVWLGCCDREPAVRTRPLSVRQGVAPFPQETVPLRCQRTGAEMLSCSPSQGLQSESEPATLRLSLMFTDVARV